MRSHLLKVQSKNPSPNVQLRINKMDKTTRTHFRLWKGVYIAKDVGGSGVLNQLHLQGVPLGDGLVPNTFAVFFESKIRSLANQARVSASVYNSHLR